MKLAVLDRDGVINIDSDEYIKSPEEFVPIPGSIEAIARFNLAGIPVVVATNQSGLARGLFNLDTLERIHQKFFDLLASAGAHVEKIYYCPHAPQDACDCRKPKPGMLRQILNDFNVRAEDVTVFGDSLRDLQMAAALGAGAVLVKTGNGEISQTKLADDQRLCDTPVYENLYTAVEAMLKQ